VHPVGYLNAAADDYRWNFAPSPPIENECAVAERLKALLQRYAPTPQSLPKLDTAGPDGYFLCAHNG
jgi:hypothetical protein